MPLISFEINKLSKKQKEQVVKEFTETASKVTDIPKEDFYVFIKENMPDNVGVGGILQSNKLD